MHRLGARFHAGCGLPLSVLSNGVLPVKPNWAPCTSRHFLHNGQTIVFTPQLVQTGGRQTKPVSGLLGGEEGGWRGAWGVDR